MGGFQAEKARNGTRQHDADQREETKETENEEAQVQEADAANEESEEKVGKDLSRAVEFIRQHWILLLAWHCAFRAVLVSKTLDR